MKSTEQSDRWTPSLLETTNRFESRPGVPKEVRDSPFGNTADGLKDYRQWVLREGLKYHRIVNADFSDMRCEWAGAFIDCTVEGSSFDRATIEGRFVGKAFTGCSFGCAVLRRASLFGRFTDCDFSGASLDGTRANGATFVRCRFDGTNLRRALLTSCLFEDCSFDGAAFHNGSLAGSRFVGRSPDPAALGNTMMDHVKLT